MILKYTVLATKQYSKVVEFDVPEGTQPEEVDRVMQLVTDECRFAPADLIYEDRDFYLTNGVEVRKECK